MLLVEGRRRTKSSTEDQEVPRRMSRTPRSPASSTRSSPKSVAQDVAKKDILGRKETDVQQWAESVTSAKRETTLRRCATLIPAVTRMKRNSMP